MKEPAHKAWPRPLPKLEIPAGQRPKTPFLNPCPPPSALPRACRAVLGPWVQGTRVLAEVTPAQRVRGCQQSQQPRAGRGLVGAVLQVPTAAPSSLRIAVGGLGTGRAQALPQLHPV